MASGVKIKRSGVRWSEAIERGALLDAARATLEECIPQLAEKVRAEAPRDEGALIGSVRWEIEKDWPVGRVIVGSKEVFYVRFIEFGAIHRGSGGTFSVSIDPFMARSMKVFRRKIASSWRANLKKYVTSGHPVKRQRRRVTG